VDGISAPEVMMDKREQDRVLRLVALQNLLCKNPRGVTIKEMAEECGVSERTVRRDLEVLEQVPVPIYQEGDRYRVVEGHFLPPIHFTRPEVMALFLAVRLLLSYSNSFNPNVQSAFSRLCIAIEDPVLRDYIRQTLDWMSRQKRDDHFVHVMDRLTDAWLKRHPVRIRYRSLEAARAEDRVIEPYFVQPAALEHANYVIGYCRKNRGIRIYKVERIEDIKVLEGERYRIRPDFDPDEYLSSLWGITAYGQKQTVKLKFSRALARVARETRWHRSQTVAAGPGDTTIVTLSVPVTAELVNFVLGWGEDVEVLEPESLRNRVIQAAGRVVEMYRKNGE
jgi:predicted DNA-binding transcriptional regulator YafY